MNRSIEVHEFNFIYGFTLAKNPDTRLNEIELMKLIFFHSHEYLHIVCEVKLSIYWILVIFVSREADGKSFQRALSWHKKLRKQ